jgi:hypothetical protein
MRHESSIWRVSNFKVAHPKIIACYLVAWLVALVPQASQNWIKELKTSRKEIGLNLSSARWGKSSLVA